VRALYATHVGVDIPRRADRYTCTRCGIVKTVAQARRNKEGVLVVKDRATYKCTDCLHVEAEIERGTNP